MVKLEIITKKYLLAGFETAIDLKESHWQGMDEVKYSLKAYLDKIINKIEPARFIGIWEADPDVDYSNPENHTKRFYFFGVEVQNTDGVPASCIIKDLPESTFAVFREREHGSPKYEWLHEAGHTPDREFQQKFALDLEIYDDIDAGGLEWDVIIPIVNK